MNLELLEMNKKDAIKGSIQTTLKETFNTTTKQNIYSIASTYDLAGRSKMNKDELIDNLIPVITEPENLKEILSTLDEEQSEFLNELYDVTYVEKECLDKSTYKYLHEHGIVFPYFNNDKLYFVMPDEIKKAYKNVMPDTSSTPNKLVDDSKNYITPNIIMDDKQAVSVKVGRNDPCPCGSGKKYKKCCGR